mmetsp:Transcript_77470/g.250667  ORF Transcript_77470/g.250667 Transcript_77470/m.250667 type:complete len:226 (+) Transcript_77470:691-1368(+)
MSAAMTWRVRLRMPRRTLPRASATVLPWQRCTRRRLAWCRGSLPVRTSRSPSWSSSALVLGLGSSAQPSPSSCVSPNCKRLFRVGARWLCSNICRARWSFCIRHSSRRGAPQTGMACMACTTTSLRPCWKNLSFSTRSHQASAWRMRSSCGQDHLSFSRAGTCVGGSECRSPISRSRCTAARSSGSWPEALFLSHSARSSPSHGAPAAASFTTSGSRAPRKCSRA